MAQKYPNLTVIDHPVLQHKLGKLREKETRPVEFRELIHEISFFLAYECTRDLPSKTHEIETPWEKTKTQVASNRLTIASILRAGEGMLYGFMKVIPFASVGHIGIYRDKQIDSTIEYYFKLPHDVKGNQILLIDPLLATGDTALAAIERLKEYEVGQIHMITLLAAPIGVEKLLEYHPDVKITSAALERDLNEQGYILPGIGDAGDRIFGTL